jgi:DNA-binding transcriptional regulator YhcF (GntR family)
MIRIDTNSPKPLEEQIAGALKQTLAQGTMGPGDELPSVRQLAGDLGVHFNTVARAYQRLANEGLISVRRGRSAVIRPQRKAATRLTRSDLERRLAEAVATALLGGLSPDDITKTFQEALAGFGERTKS